MTLRGLDTGDAVAKTAEAAVKAWRPAGFEGLELESLTPGPAARPLLVCDHYSLQVVTQARSRVFYQRATQTISIKEPTLVLQNPGEIFGYEDVGDVGVRARAFNLPPDLLGRLSADCGTPGTPYFPKLLVGEAHGIHLARLLGDLFRRFEHPASQLEREAGLLDLLAQIVRLCSQNPPPARRLGNEHRAVGLIKHHLRDHYSEEVTLKELAALTGFNKDYLLKVFTRDTGVSPHVYLTCVRIHHAKDFLARGWSIAQAAYATGFADQSHLHHTFRRYAMTTPGRYQRDNRG